MVNPFSQAGGMRLDHVYGTFLSLRRPQTPQDAATATAPRPPKVPPAAAIIPRPLPAPVIAPTPAPVNALLPDQPHPSQGILATSSSGAACLVYYIYGAAQAVALAAQAAGTPFDPCSLDLPSIGSLVGFYHACLGFPVKQTWLDTIKAGNCDTFDSLTYSNAAKYCPDVEETIMGHLALPSNARMSGQQNPNSQRRRCLWCFLLPLLHLPTRFTT